MKKTLLQFFSLLVALLSWGANAQAASQLTVTYLAANETSVTRNSPSAPFMVSVDVSFLNLTNQRVAMQIGIGYYDVAQQLVSSTFITDGSFNPNMGFGQDGMTIPLGAGLADGTYYVKLLNRESEGVAWRPMDRADQYYLEMVIAGNTAQLINHADGEEEAYHLDVNFVVEGCVGDPNAGYEVEGNTIKGVARITNDGNHDYDNEFVYTLYRHAEGEDAGSSDFDAYEEVKTLSVPVNVKAGETVEVPFEFGDLDYAYLYTLAGRYHVSEDYMADEITFGSIKLIGDAPIDTYHLDLGFVVEGCVGNPDTGYEVEGNTLKGVVRITNDGNHDYDKSIAYKLYRQEGSGRVEVENYSRPLELKVGDATEVPFEFDGLDHTYAYTLAVSYYVSEDKMSDEITFGPLHLKEVETFSLDVDFKIENCTGDETTGYEVTGNKIKGVMVVANQSGHDYADEFSCTLYDGTERVPFTTSIEVKAGETIEVPFEFDNLNYEGEYMLYVGYCYEEGSMMDFFIFGPFTLIDPATGIEGVEVDGEAEADQPVYNLQGVRMPDGASLPKGIYIRGGKKFVVK